VPKVQKWGNGLGIRIPAAVAKELNLKAGTPVEVATRNGSLVVTTPAARKYSLRELLKGWKPEHRHDLIDFGPDVGREVID
jgi:antitoxin MazE